MSGLYRVMDIVLPFSFLEYDFMKNALLAILIITPLFAMLGTIIVNNKMAFFSDALGHSAYTGIAVGVICGVVDFSIPMILFAVVYALCLNRIKRKRTVSTDTVISVFASLGIALGLVILSKGGNFSKYSYLLIGDILSVTTKQILSLVLIFAIVLLFWGLFFNQLHALSINESLARSKGYKVEVLDDIFAVLIAIVIMLSIQWVGSLIINALLIIPAAASRNIARNVREYHWFAILISLFSGVTGLVFSYINNTATGPTIVLTLAVVFFLSLAVKPVLK